MRLIPETEPDRKQLAIEAMASFLWHTANLKGLGTHYDYHDYYDYCSRLLDMAEGMMEQCVKDIETINGHAH